MFRLKNKDKKLLSYLMMVFNITLLINMIWYLLTFLNVKQVIRLPIVAVLLAFKLVTIIRFFCLRKKITIPYDNIYNIILYSLSLILIIQINTQQGICYFTNILFNVLIVMLPLAILYLLSQHLHTILFIVLFIAVDIISIVMYNTLSYRGTAVTWNDVFGVSTAANMLDGYKPIFATDMLYSQAILVAIIGYMLLPYITKNHTSNVSKYKSNIPIILITIASLFAFHDKILDTDISSYINGKCDTGIIQNLYHMFMVRDVKKPDNYENYLKEYKSYETVINSSSINPDIIVIMNESFSDMEELQHLKLSNNPLENFDRMCAYDSVKSGNTIVPYVGGLTCNTEFEILSGLSNIFFSYGYIPYMECIKNPFYNYVTYFNNMGYDTIAFHPFWSIGWNRNQVYDFVGFHKVIFGEELANMDRIEKWSGDAESNYLAFGDKYEYVRTFISDEQDYKIIKQELDTQSDKPKFIFNVTIQNHGSYKNYSGNPVSNNIKVLSDIEDKESMEQYINLIDLSDDAIADLVEYCSNRNKPTVVCILGDHIPGLQCNRGVGTLEYFKTPYLMYKNYDIPNQDIINEDFSTNYFMFKLLEFAGLPLDKTSEYLKALNEEYPIIGINSGVYDNKGNKISDYENVLNKYLGLMYYRLFDS